MYIHILVIFIGVMSFYLVYSWNKNIILNEKYSIIVFNQIVLIEQNDMPWNINIFHSIGFG